MCSSSTGQWQLERSQLLLQKNSVEIKNCSKWPSPALTDTERRRRRWCTASAMTAWSSLAHSVLMHCLRSWRSVTRLLYTFSCSMPYTHCSQLDLSPANLEATIEAEWILNYFSSCKNDIFKVRHHYILSCKYSSRMHFMSHNWSATKRRLHPQSVAEISRHSVLSGDRIWQCDTSSGSRHKDTDQCL